MAAKVALQEVPAAAPSAPARDPFALLQVAIEKNMDPEQLGKLMDLQERWERNRAVEAFNAALSRVQEKAPIVVRDAENKHTRSKYARLEAVNNVIKPIYTAEGFSLSFGTEESKLPGHIRIVADLRHAAGHSARYSHDLPLDGTGAKGGQIAMNALQASGSTLSYGRRYLVCLIFNVTVADEDNDGMGGFISPEQIEEINALIEEVKRSGKPFDFTRFLAWLCVESLDKLPQGKVSRALLELGRKRRMPATAGKGGAA
jgi:hypothetical protein